MGVPAPLQTSLKGAEDCGAKPASTQISRTVKDQESRVSNCVPRFLKKFEAERIEAIAICIKKTIFYSLPAVGLCMTGDKLKYFYKILTVFRE